MFKVQKRDKSEGIVSLEMVLVSQSWCWGRV